MDSVAEGVRRFIATLRPTDRFTTNDCAAFPPLVDYLTDRYTDPKGRAARRAVANTLNAMARHNDKIEALARHHGGRSVYEVLPPPPTQPPDNGPVPGETQITFTFVGHTSDAAELWRNDATGDLGWVSFEPL